MENKKILETKECLKKDLVEKITLKELEDTGLTISPSQLQSLLPIIED